MFWNKFTFLKLSSCLKFLALCRKEKTIFYRGTQSYNFTFDKILNGRKHECVTLKSEHFKSYDKKDFPHY